MLTIVSQIQAVLEKASPIRKLSDAALTGEIAVLRPLQDALEPKKSVPSAKAPVARCAAPTPTHGAAAPQSITRSQPLSKGSIFSKRPANLRPIAPVVPSVIAIAVSAQNSVPSVDISTVPMELRRLLKLRLQLCETERTGRERQKIGGRKPFRAPVLDRGQPQARQHLWSCAKDVILDVPAEPVTGPCRAQPNSRGNWVRLLPDEIRRPEK